jgi:NADPH:quinone reductase-like Zn-dependent oxidoreductase
MEHRFPVVLGKDFAGTVEAVGTGVDDLVVCDEVFGVVMKPYVGTAHLYSTTARPLASPPKARTVFALRQPVHSA